MGLRWAWCMDMHSFIICRIHLEKDPAAAVVAADKTRSTAYSHGTVCHMFHLSPSTLSHLDQSLVICLTTERRVTSDHKIPVIWSKNDDHVCNQYGMRECTLPEYSTLET